MMLFTFILLNCFWMLCNCSQQPTTTKVLRKKINETVYASGNIDSNSRPRVCIQL